jgi:hypothetical protein
MPPLQSVPHHTHHSQHTLLFTPARAKRYDIIGVGVHPASLKSTIIRRCALLC